MGGYGSSDITANIEVNLNNIDRSTQDAATLASQLKDWGTSIEAANKQLQDYTTSQSELLQTSNDLAETHERIVAAARELKEISAQSGVNLRDMAQNAREIQSALSGLGGVGAAPYTPGVSSASPASIVDSGLGYGMGMPGAPESTPADFGMSTGGNSFLDDLISAGMTGGGSGGGKATSPVSMKGVLSPEDTKAAYGESLAKKILGINYFMPGGKLAALGRYVDKVSGGKVIGKLGNFVSNHPRIFGSPSISSGSEAFTQSMIDSGIGPMTAEQAGMLPESVAASIMPEIGTAAASAEVVGGLGAAGIAGSAGMIGALGSVAAAAAPVAVLAYLGMQGYNAYASYQQQGQILGSLTGQTGKAGRMVGMEATDYFGTMFNPLLNYGTAKEIQMTGLGAGFQGNPNGVFGGDASSQGLLGQYTGFASNAYQNYGMSPQESMGMFQAGVIQAGASAQQLTGALHSLANVSATTNTSFSLLKENFTNFLGAIAGVGGTGVGAIALAQNNALTNANNPLLGGAGSTASILQGNVGQALAAQALGISYTQVYNEMGTTGGAQALAGASNTAVLGVLANMGLRPGMPNLKEAVGNLAYALPTILTQLGVAPPNGKPWTQETAVHWVMQALSSGGHGESSSVGAVKGLTGLMNALTDSQSGAGGLRAMIRNLDNAEITHQGHNPYAAGAKTAFEVTLNGQRKTLYGSDIMNLSASDQQKIQQELLAGTATVGQIGSSGERFGFNRKNTIASLYQNKTLSAIDNGSITQNSLQLELGPKAAALFELINNPQKLTNQQIKYLSSMGLNTNTYQGTGWG